MSGLLLEPLSQIPWLYVLCILLVSVVAVIYNSKMTGLDVRREISVLVRGLVYIIIFSLVVFSTVGFLKYTSYLKIDIMQLSGFEFFVVSIMATMFIAWKSLFSEVKVTDVGIFRFLKSIPYLLRQVLLLLSLSFIVYLYSPEMSIFEIVVAVVPVTVLYHLYRMGVIDKIFVGFIDGLNRVDSVVDNVFGFGARGAGKNKIKGGNKTKPDKRWGSKK